MGKFPIRRSLRRPLSGAIAFFGRGSRCARKSAACSFTAGAERRLAPGMADGPVASPFRMERHHED